VRYPVRHAGAGDKGQWSGLDEQRPLSDVGRLEADGLVALLADFPVVHIVSSPALRCAQTVQPLARTRELAVSTDVALARDADVDHAVELLLDPDADGVVWCSHRELIAPVMVMLQDLGAPISDKLELAKGSVWVIEVADGAVTEARYLPPFGG
jgi:phosphohistidine phosphatase SixA